MIKKIRLVILFAAATYLTRGTMAQEKEIPISLSYSAPYFIQPGFRLGMELAQKRWEAVKERKGKSLNVTKSLYIQPQVGFYARPRVHNNWLLNAELGYKRKRNDKKGYSNLSVGLGFVQRSQILSLTVDLSSGEITDKDRETQNYFMPTVNYEMGRIISPKMGWFTKLSLGALMATKQEGHLVLIYELGLKYNLKLKSQ
ncbi:MAG: hypothetical protein AAGF85_13320 [Bacteroidota bacterium]